MASVARRIRSTGAPGRGERQLRRSLAGKQPFNRHLISVLADDMKCSPGWLLCGVGHPDYYTEPPELDQGFLASVQLNRLPKMIRERVIKLAWAVSMRRNGNRSDAALREYAAICKELATWIKEPVDSKYFDEIWTDISWINYAGRVLDALESLPIRAEVIHKCPECSEEISPPEPCQECFPNESPDSREDEETE